MSKNFDSYSVYYDLLYKDKNYVNEIKYIKKILKNYGIVKGNILDVGCGTGIHIKELSKSNYNLYGIDLSEKMIELAKIRNENNKSILKVSDARNYFSKIKFEAIISLFHVASYQTLNQDLDAYFKSASRNLKKKGIFIFDFWYGPGVLHDKPKTRIKRFQNHDFKILRIAESEILINENIVNVDFTINILDKISNKNYELKELHKMRYFFLPELKYFLEKNNLEFEFAEEIVTNKALCEKTWTGLVVAKKK